MWPLESIDHAVLTAIGGDVLQPEAIEAIVAEARVMFEAGSADDRAAALRMEVEQLRTEQERLADAIASGGRFPGLMAKLDATERAGWSSLRRLTKLPRRRCSRLPGARLSV